MVGRKWKKDLKIVHLLHHFSGERLNLILETEKEVNPQIGEKEKCSDLKWVKINALPNKTTKKVR